MKKCITLNWQFPLGGLIFQPAASDLVRRGPCLSRFYGTFLDVRIVVLRIVIRGAPFREPAPALGDRQLDSAIAGGSDLVIRAHRGRSLWAPVLRRLGRRALRTGRERHPLPR